MVWVNEQEVLQIAEAKQMDYKVSPVMILLLVVLLLLPGATFLYMRSHPTPHWLVAAAVMAVQEVGRQYLMHDKQRNRLSLKSKVTKNST